MNSYISKSEQETTRIGQAIGDALEPGTVIGLNGTLGAGKTRLTQAIGMGLGIAAGNIVSPTFTIAVPYEGRLPLLHLDAYRIGQPEEIDELGLDELTEDGVVLIVEWAERVVSLLPPLDVEITIEPTGEDSRLFHFNPLTPVGQRVVDAVVQRLKTSVAD